MCGPTTRPITRRSRSESGHGKPSTRARATAASIPPKTPGHRRRKLPRGRASPHPGARSCSGESSSCLRTSCRSTHRSGCSHGGASRSSPRTGPAITRSSTGPRDRTIDATGTPTSSTRRSRSSASTTRTGTRPGATPSKPPIGCRRCRTGCASLEATDPGDGAARGARAELVHGARRHPEHRASPRRSREALRSSQLRRDGREQCRGTARRHKAGRDRRHRTRCRSLEPGVPEMAPGDGRDREHAGETGAQPIRNARASWKPSRRWASRWVRTRRYRREHARGRHASGRRTPRAKRRWSGSRRRWDERRCRSRWCSDPRGRKSSTTTSGATRDEDACAQRSGAQAKRWGTRARRR